VKVQAAQPKSWHYKSAFQAQHKLQYHPVSGHSGIDIDTFAKIIIWIYYTLIFRNRKTQILEHTVCCAGIQGIN
jgi:hypothetical protein